MPEKKFIKQCWFSFDELKGLYFIPKGVPERVAVFTDRIHRRLRQGAEGPRSQYVMELLYLLDRKLTANRYVRERELLDLPISKTYEDLKLWVIEWGEYFCNPWSHYPAIKIYKDLVKAGYRAFHKMVLEYSIVEIKLTWEAEDERYIRKWYIEHPERDPSNTELFGKKRKRGRSPAKLTYRPPAKNDPGT